MRIPLSLLLISTLLLGGIAGFAQSVGLSEPNPDYRIQPTDVLEVHYRYTPEFDQTVSVQPDGKVTLRIVGELVLRGLTLEQIKASILEKAAQRLKEPEVTIVLKEFEKPYFIVAGEVANPGRFEMRGSVNPLEAVAMAGGLKAVSAKHSQVILFRRVGLDLAQTKLLDLKAAMSPSGAESLSDLKSGDMLIVPQNRISKIERFVKWGSFGMYLNPFTF